MSHSRGSAAQFGEVLSDALKRIKANADYLAKVMGESGYPPLTAPITLRDLKKMPEEQAVAILRDELARTTERDPATGEMVVNPETLRLVTSYVESQVEVQDGG